MPTPMQAAIMSSGAYAAYVDMWFAANTYRVAGVTSGDLPLVTGFTFTGASLRTMFDSTGKLTYGPNNLLLYSQEFDNAAYTKAQATVSANTTTAPDGTSTADSLLETSVSNIHYAYQSAASYLLTDNIALVSVYAKRNTRDYVTIGISDISVGTRYAVAVFNLQTGALSTSGASGTGYSVAATSITSVGNGWYRCSVVCVIGTSVSFNRAVFGISSTGVITAAAGGLQSYLGDGSGIYLWGAQLEAVTYATTPSTYYPTTSAAYYGPRLVYDPVTLASLGILVEEARTNLCLQSSDLTNASWVAQAATTAKTATGPDGAANSATTVTATAANAYVKQLITSASASRTTSAYIKRRTGSGTVTLSHGDTTGADLVVNGDFASDTVWTKGTGWVIAAGAATFVGGTPDYLKQTGIVTVGKIYKVTFTVTAIVGAASLSTYIGDSPSLGAVSALGTYSYIGMAAVTTLGLAFRGNSSSGATSISIDNVSMYEVVQTTATVTSDWTRVATPTATITDPIVGIRVATSGDAVDIAYVQCEAGTGASSPIPTTTAAVTRAADVPLLTGLVLTQAFSIVSAAKKSNDVDATGNVAACSDGTNSNRLGVYVTGPVTMRAFGALAGSGAFAEGGSLTAGSPFKQAVSFDGVTTFSTTGNGGAVGTATKAINTPVLTQLAIGQAPSGIEVLNGTISRIRIYNRALNDAQLQALTA